jgi:hypothetical protein
VLAWLALPVRNQDLVSIPRVRADIIHQFFFTIILNSSKGICDNKCPENESMGVPHIIYRVFKKDLQGLRVERTRLSEQKSQSI